MDILEYYKSPYGSQDLVRGNNGIAACKSGTNKMGGKRVATVDGVCYSFDYGDTVDRSSYPESRADLLPPGGTVDIALADKLKLAKIFCTPDECEFVCTDFPAGQVKPRISLIKPTDEIPGNYGFNFIDVAGDATEAKTVTQTAATTNESKRFSFFIQIVDPEGKTPEDKVLYSILNTEKDSKWTGEESMQLIKNAKVCNWIHKNGNSSIDGTADIKASFKKNGTWDGNKVFEPLASQDSDLRIGAGVHSKDGDGNITSKFKIELLLSNWNKVLTWKSGRPGESISPKSGYEGKVGITLSEQGNSDKVEPLKQEIALYFPLSTFFVGIKNVDTTNSSPIHQDLSAFMNYKKRHICILGSGGVDPVTDANCSTAYETTAFTLRFLNLGGVGGTIGNHTVDQTEHTKLSGGSTYSAGNIPNWWGQPQQMPSGGNMGFYSLSEIFVTITPYKTNIATPPAEGEILLSGGHKRVMTFESCNFGSDNEFTLYLYVPSSDLNV
jgi:hypothetical protein